MHSRYVSPQDYSRIQNARRVWGVVYYVVLAAVALAAVALTLA